MEHSAASSSVKICIKVSKKVRLLVSILVLLTAFSALVCAETINVVIVTGKAESELGYTQFLQDVYRGNISVQINADRYEGVLSAELKSEIESADLIIVSCDADSKDYNADSSFWNDLSVPILNHNAKLARSGGHDYWDWMDRGAATTDPLTHIAVAAPDDQIFEGIDISSGTVQMLTVGTAIDHSSQPSAGYGIVIAASNDDVVIARWLGSESSYYAESVYAPAGPRLFFAMPKPTYEFFDDATDDGKLMLKNAILSLAPVYRPTADLDNDGDVDCPDFAVFAVYWGDSGCTKGVPCAEADLTGDANVASGDLALIAEHWLEGVDSVPPEPNVMAWQTEPMALSTTSIYMTAMPASDADNGVEYYFQCISGNGPDSGWQYANTFEPNTLTPAWQYEYRAKARDTSSRLNETNWSETESVWTFGLHYEIADASAAVALDGSLFIAAGDETAMLCIYDWNDVGSAPIMERNVETFLNIDPVYPELDIEGATWFNGRIFWITSHGRNKDGEYRLSRYQFFATTVTQPGPDADITVNGNCFDLISHLIEYDSVYDLGVSEAIGVVDGHIDPNTIPALAPKEQGINIEGLCASSDGTSMFIAFRNPIPRIGDANNALIINLRNPEEVVLNGAEPDFDPPILLNLDGLGIRSMEYSPVLGRYLIIAGAHSAGGDTSLEILYAYDMPTGILTMLDQFPVLTPEAVFQFPDSKDIQILSDDGDLMIDTPEGRVKNKDLPREQRTFRTRIITP